MDSKRKPEPGEKITNIFTFFFFLGMLSNYIDQWDDTYPDAETIFQDLKNQTYYVVEEKGKIIGGINIDQNQDPTY